MKVLFDLYDKVMGILQKKDLERICAWLLMILTAVMVIPILALSIYNVPVGDDLGHTFGVHMAWHNNPSIAGFFAAVGQAWVRMADIYQGWGGNYTSFFFSALQPIAFSEKLAFVGTFLFIFGLLFGEAYFLKEMLCRYFKVEKYTFLLILAGVYLLQTQWLTSARQAFYWYSGSVTNTLGFAASLVFLTNLMKIGRTKKVTVKQLIANILLAAFIGGCNYSSLMSLWTILFLYCLNLCVDHELQKQDKVKVFVMIGVLLAGTIISVVAPGNTVRQAVNNGSSALSALVNAILQGRMLFFSYVNLKVIILTVLFLPFVWNQIDVKNQYRLPLLVLIISCGVFCAALTPTMKSDSDMGPRRTHNVYWWIFLNLYVMNMLYMCGWLKRKLQERFTDKRFEFTKSHQIGFLVAVCVMVACTFQLQELKGTPFVQATLDLVSGRAQQFGQQMQERYKLYYSDEKDITVSYIKYVPQLFVEELNVIYANEPGEVEDTGYYEKHSITVVEE